MENVDERFLRDLAFLNKDNKNLLIFDTSRL
jgi:hypothetical protein